MPDHLEAQLIGYLLNALDEEEREQLEAELAQRPGLRRRLRQLKEFFEVLDKTREEWIPPEGLVTRTCALVARDRVRCGQPNGRSGPVAARAVAGNASGATYRSGKVGFRWAPLGDHWAGERSSWSLLDLLASCVVIFLLATLLLPALVETRFHHQVVACQENLHRLYTALGHYHTLHPEVRLAALNGQDVPFVALGAPSLVHFGYEPQGCPGWSVKQVGREIPGETELASLGSPMGYACAPWSLSPSSPQIDGEMVSLPSTVICRDARVASVCGSRSWNHMGRGENWLFADGHVQFVPQPAVVAWERPTFQTMVEQVSIK
ncbi:hypothetical protein THTE_1605 [Thermogutta terrifontis]|uniref:DUF1559 domain-containing protein n=1 Tax=Thermogutta terrifontis TaxID=1331910 RepID=A0A286RE37_9BACT|nr:hypothetical protein [Thermogutta terrifontis]ASV74207.1 hypothetical protein THTE_1605 [Thermogutta terrifontis]